MYSSKRQAWLAAAMIVSLLILSANWLYASNKKKDKKNAASQMDERRQALHALNRLTFGPRPGDVERVMAMGVDKWIDQQLNPQKIDDQQLEARLRPFRTLQMSAREMLENFPPPQVLKAISDGKMNIPRDAEKRAVYEAALERYRRRKEDQAQQQQPQADAQSVTDEEMTPEQRQHRREARQRARAEADRLMAMSPEDRMDVILKMDPEDRTAMVRGLNPQERMALVQGMDPKQVETLVAMANPQAVIVGELQQSKVLRAAYSERQLEEVMTDFWLNHFNVFINKGADRYLVTSYERDVIRPHALGKFKDLLLATAKSPALLFYLDNWQSVGPYSQAAEFARTGQLPNQRFGRRAMRRRQSERIEKIRQRIPKGLNENYAREIMELHTLGVNGGYTQQDVTELAKVLTGWTLRQPRRGGGYDFNPKMHEPGDKNVLGQRFKEDGEKEGEKAIAMLARHPSTAHFISSKLATRFVSDNPPDSLVNRMADTFRNTDGDIKEVLRTMFHSPEFWAPEAYRAKVKTPIEFIVSAVRATGADAQFAQSLVQNLNKMGMPLYGAQPPTGYSMKADAWVNSAALLDRMNFALALGTGRLPGVQVNTARISGSDVPSDAAAVQARLENALLGGDISKQTHETIRKQLDDPQVTRRAYNDAPRPVDAGVIAGLILGSPEFQRR